MKWKTKSRYVPEEGERRKYTKFAYLSVELENGITIWWETYWVEEELRWTHVCGMEPAEYEWVWHIIRRFQKESVL